MSNNFTTGKIKYIYTDDEQLLKVYYGRVVMITVPMTNRKNAMVYAKEKRLELEKRVREIYEVSVHDMELMESEQRTIA